jgi:hypothetical protein
MRVRGDGGERAQPAPQCLGVLRERCGRAARCAAVCVFDSEDGVKTEGRRGVMLAVRLGAGVRARPAVLVAYAAGPAVAGVGVAVHAEDSSLHPLFFDAADSVESTLPRHAVSGLFKPYLAGTRVWTECR